MGSTREVEAGELRDVGELLLDHLARQVTHVEPDAVAARPDAAPLLDLLVDRPGDEVAGSEVLHGRRVALHEPLFLTVQQDAPLAAHRLARAGCPSCRRPSGETGRTPCPRAGCLDGRRWPEPSPVSAWAFDDDLEHPAGAAGGEHHRLRAEDVQLSGGELVGDDAGRAPLAHQQVEHVELVEEADVALHALLVEGLQDHVPGAVRCVAGALHRGLAVVARVAAEPALVDLAVRRAVERQPPVLQLVDGVDGLPRTSRAPRGWSTR